MTEIEKVLCDIVHQYCFDWVWNEPLSEFRENIKPILLSQKSQSGCFIYKNTLIPVPSDIEGPFFMYGLFYSDIAKVLNIPTETWISLETLCNDYNILIDMYGYKGKVLHKSQVFIHLNTYKTRVLFAVQKDMCKKLIPISDMNEIYFTVYYDSDMVDNCQVECYQVPINDTSMTYRANLQTRLNDLKLTTQNVVMYINGIESTHFEPSLEIGDYFDIIIDENIKIIFDVDLTDTTQDFGYYSDADQTYKQIIHIPKNLNPDNKVITHNTCDIWVRRKNPLTKAVEGLYLHRAAKRGVTQITHNDFSIPLYILDAFRDHLATQDITLHVVCRIHDKDNVLTRDASFIDLLYTQDDTQIKTILKGRGVPDDISFWKASSLEKTPFVKMFFDLPKLYSVNLDYYVEALGYYHVLVLLASRVTTKTVDNPDLLDTGILRYEKPPLYKGYKTFPVVYLNGLKIKNEFVKYIDLGDIIDINLTSDIILNTGDNLTTVLYLDGDKSIYRVTPTSDNKFINIAYTNFRIYQETTDLYREFKGVDQSSNVSYIDITDTYGIYSVEQVNGYTQIGFGTQMYDKTYVIVNERCSYSWKVDISDKVSIGENIVIPLEYGIVNTIIPQTVPLLNFKNTAIYLNNHYLIKDLDYIINTIYDHNGNISFRQLVIQTMEYLVEPGNNVIEILLNTDETDDRSLGFQINNICVDPTPANLWFPTVSLLHVEGQIETQVVDKGVYLTLPTDKYRQAAPYEVCTSVPAAIREFISKYHTNQDKTRISNINTYFGQITPIPFGIVLLKKSHRIYSTMLNRVIRDIVFNGKTFADDPDLNRVMEQLKDYDYLRPLDLVQIDAIDSEFVDYNPSYRQYESSMTPDMLLAVRTIIASNLPQEAIRNKAVTKS